MEQVLGTTKRRWTYKVRTSTPKSIVEWKVVREWEWIEYLKWCVWYLYIRGSSNCPHMFQHLVQVVVRLDSTVIDVTGVWSYVFSREECPCCSLKAGFNYHLRMELLCFKDRSIVSNNLSLVYQIVDCLVNT